MEVPLSTHATFDSAAERHQMVALQIAARGIRDPRILEAFRAVPREAFLPVDLAEFTYQDTPLPIGDGQTISQPYIVALMTEALRLKPGDRVLEVGTGSGYAAAILSRVATQVFSVERIEALAYVARRRLERLGFSNVQVLHGDGSVGWLEHAPYDAITVAAGGPDVPETLLSQLAPGGRLVMPVGSTPRRQSLVRVTRRGSDQYDREDLEEVRFVPLIGVEGWGEPATERVHGARATPSRPAAVTKLIREEAEPIASIEGAELGPLLDRIGEARLVLLGEATHGTSEFYRMRARITQELIERRGFNIVAVEADWPDAARVDAYARNLPCPRSGARAFTRFPTWMWRNEEVKNFVEWLRKRNAAVKDPDLRTGFHGLDLYSLHASIQAVLEYLDRLDPEAARIARRRYGCLTPWESDPAAYGQAVTTGSYRSCEEPVVAMLKDLLAKRLDYMSSDGECFHDAVQNARLVASGEGYYRSMFYGSKQSWNLRDQHMFETLETVLSFRGPRAKAVVWEHNSHVGNAAATEMRARGEHNVGQLVRERHGNAAYLVGFGTDRGTVAAASEWGGPMEVKDVRPAHADSYEKLCHDTKTEAFLLHLREPSRKALRDELLSPRLERAIGVIYRPETELLSHYFQAILPLQFDEYVWFDVTSSIAPLDSESGRGMPDTYPFGL